MPLAIEQIDLSQYDLILPSSHAVAKGVITGPRQLHISYVHSPIRYAWDLQHQYLKESNLRGLKGWAARYLLHKIRIWDCQTANRVDYFIANSYFISDRIRKVYRRDTKVIYPPVDVGQFVASPKRKDYYLTVSRLVPYKRIDLIVEAFSKLPEKQLVVIGEGPEHKKLMSKATSNIKLLGYQSDDIVKKYLSEAQCFIYAAEEDFGISPVEAQASGVPVIALGKGGTAETINDITCSSPTGVLYNEQDTDDLVNAIIKFEQSKDYISAYDCIENAKRFSTEKFTSQFKKYVDERVHDFF